MINKYKIQLKFNQLYFQIEDYYKCSSSLNYDNDSDFKELLALDKSIIHLLLNKLGTGWLAIAVLEKIIKEFEYPVEIYGNFEKISEYWFNWGYFAGY